MSELEQSGARPARRSSASSRGDVVLAVPAEDLLWEADLVLLVSTLEQMRIALSEQCHQGHAVPALDRMRQMVEQLTEVARRPAVANLPDAQLFCQQVEGFLEDLKHLRQRVDRSLMRSLARLFGQARAESDPRDQFVGLVRAVYALHGIAFRVFASGFRSPVTVRAWDETQAVFLKDLKQLVDDVGG